MRTKEDLNALKEEVETLNNKLAQLSEEELEQVSGGQHQQEINALNALKNYNRHVNAVAKNIEQNMTGQKIIHEKENPISGAIGKHIEELKQRLDEQR